MSTVANLKNRVYRLLINPEQDAYDSELFYDALGAALDAILPWFPKTAILTLAGDGGNTQALPTDIYITEACVDDATGEMLPKANLIPGYTRGEDIAATNDWLEFPSGSLTFSKAITVGETYTLYYLAHWSKPTSEDDEEDTNLETPEFLDTALVLYATAQMILPSALSASEVRQFNTKVDSGNPEHNPMQQTSKYLLRLFMDEMSRHPKYQRAQR